MFLTIINVFGNLPEITKKKLRNTTQKFVNMCTRSQLITTDLHKLICIFIGWGKAAGSKLYKRKLTMYSNFFISPTPLNIFY